MKKEDWYPLDNAAQIFPIVSSKDDSNGFRISAVLKEDVIPEILKEAVLESLKRFPSFCVRLRKGAFWYYLEHNDQEPIIREESPYYCESNNYAEQKEFLFNISYMGKRLSLEIFHGITDGTGATEFFKSICYYYLVLKGYQITNNGEILTNDVEQLLDETQDSFKYNYSKWFKKLEKGPKAFRITGRSHSRTWVGCIQLIIDVETMKQVAKRYQATVTEYVSATLILAIYHQYAQGSKDERPISLFIPVNARRYFDSKSLRNFVLFMRVVTRYTGDVTFEQVLSDVKAGFAEELKKEKMEARLKANVQLETNFLTRFIPLFLKNFVVKIGYKMLGTSMNTMSFSNVGVVKLPLDMLQYIDRMEFAMGVSKRVPINVTAISCGKRMTLTFTSNIIERQLQKEVIERMLADGVTLVVETNDLEV